MRLHSMDEFPFHQQPTPFNVVATTDSKFNDGYWFSFYAAEWYFVSGLRLHPNVNAIDGFASVAHGTPQHAVRFSRALRPNYDERSVGALRLEILEPLRKLRLTLGRSCPRRPGRPRWRASAPWRPRPAGRSAAPNRRCSSRCAPGPRRACRG